MTITEKIFSLINENHLTAKDFAKLCDLSPGNITDWKTGRAKPSIDSLKKISNACNVNIEWLLDESTIKEKENIDDKIAIPNDFRYYCEDLPECIVYHIKNITHLMIITNINSSDINSHINVDMEVYNIPNSYKKAVRKAVLYLYDYNIHLALNPTTLITRKLKSIHKTINTNKSISLFSIPILGKIAAGQPILAEQYIEGYLPMDPNIYGMKTPDDYFYLRVSGESMNLKIHNGDYALIHKQDTAEDGDIVVAIVNGDNEATLKKYKRISNETVALEPMSTLPMEPIYINLKETNFKIIGKAIGKFGKF